MNNRIWIPIRLIVYPLENAIIIACIIYFMVLISSKKIIESEIFHDSLLELSIYTIIFMILIIFLLKTIWDYADIIFFYRRHKILFMFVFVLINIFLPFQFLLTLLSLKGQLIYSIDLGSQNINDYLLNLKLINVLLISLIIKNPRFSFISETEINFSSSKLLLDDIQSNFKSLTQGIERDSTFLISINSIKEDLSSKKMNIISELTTISNKIKNPKEKKELIYLIKILNKTSDFIIKQDYDSITRMLTKTKLRKHEQEIKVCFLEVLKIKT